MCKITNLIFKNIPDAQAHLKTCKSIKEILEANAAYYELIKPVLKKHEQPGIKKFKTLEDFNIYKDNLEELIKEECT